MDGTCRGTDWERGIACFNWSSGCLLRRRPEWQWRLATDAAEMVQLGQSRLAVRDGFQPLVEDQHFGDSVTVADEAPIEKPTKPAETVRKAECSECGGPRNCEIRGRYDDRYDDDDSGFSGNVTWYILECRGCEHVFVQTVSTNS